MDGNSQIGLPNDEFDCFFEIRNQHIRLEQSLALGDPPGDGDGEFNHVLQRRRFQVRPARIQRVGGLRHRPNRLLKLRFVLGKGLLLGGLAALFCAKGQAIALAFGQAFDFGGGLKMFGLHLRGGKELIRIMPARSRMRLAAFSISAIENGDADIGTLVDLMTPIWTHDSCRDGNLHRWSHLPCTQGGR